MNEEQTSVISVLPDVMLSKEKKREIHIRTGRQMLERVVRAKQEGQIKDYIVYCTEEDPEIVDTIRIIKHDG